MSSESFFNLITDTWIPVRRKSGMTTVIKPSEIVSQLESDPIIAFDWPRPDFRVASYEFMIGLLATAFPPEDKRDWAKIWRHPPSENELSAAFEKIQDAFYLNRPEKCFLQDYDKLNSAYEPVERLLINAPGEKTVKENKDLFVHRGQFDSMSLPTAAIALFTLQSWSPFGGAGNRTGLRGGGPMITLVFPYRDAPLWQVLWANTPCGYPADEEDMPKIFPWLAPTITSEKSNGTLYPSDDRVDMRQCWWGMPRRIRLRFAKEKSQNSSGNGGSTEVRVTGWQQRPHGPNYMSWTCERYSETNNPIFVHPLTPRYRKKVGEEWISLHPQPGGIDYRHWAQLAVTADDNMLCYPASNVCNWRGWRASRSGLFEKEQLRTRLLVAGYDMDGKKARNFLESEMPIPGAADPAMQRVQEEFACSCIEGALLVINVLQDAVRNSQSTNDVSLNSSLLTKTLQEFVHKTENVFFDLITRIIDDKDNSKMMEKWRRVMEVSALECFDNAVQLTPETQMQLARKIVSNRRRLGALVSCKGSKEGSKLAKILKIPVPLAFKKEKKHD
ncbi:type I-E CRISPR-associated protein Cse1/CasA [Aristophania vespae]|uniref:Type I-E CRISPR-associated protein Cse1/CasA n=1 Tax=Aristophania vespae TaxID=2697033 RepID=A0A6P1NHR2_9PROT|nr:type I-E CRISPR-associated protein Cse1/CasA [Aristophania vespae]QHI95192.1 type I-E CRISPR-associated protein Cse1/CasA [Aristophania vespae]